MFIACADRHAAIVTCKSARRVRPPETEVNACTKAGCQDITSRIASGTLTLGTIPSNSPRSSTRVAGSGIAFSAATCSLPSSSTVTFASGPSRAATCLYAATSVRAGSSRSWSGFSGNDSAVSTGPFAFAHASPSKSCARGSRHRDEPGA